MSKNAPANIPIELTIQIESGLCCLHSACEYIHELIGADGANEFNVILAIIQKAGALIETALREANGSSGTGIVGGAEEWLGIRRAEGGEQ